MTSQPDSSHFQTHSQSVGVFYGIVSALCYSLANVALRKLADGCDPIWVSCVKAVPVAAAAATLEFLRIRARRSGGLPPGSLGPLILVSLAMQLGGNVAFQWSLGWIGLAYCVPIMFGTLILGAIVMGRIWLGEQVTARSGMSLALLLAAICVLSVGTTRSRVPDESVAQAGLGSVGLAIAAACISGLAYAMGNVALRRIVRGGTSLSAPLFVVSLTGVVSLGLASCASVGPVAMWRTPQADLWTMLLAGLFNAVAFFALTRGLQLLSVVYVNALNSSQAAVAAVLGVVFFDEPLNLALGCGIALTIGGLLMMEGSRSGSRSLPPARHPEPDAPEEHES